MSLKEEKEEKMQELWDAFLAACPTVRNLRDIVYDIPSLHEKAMRQLLSQARSLTKKDLLMIMDMESPVREEFGRLLLEMEPTAEDIVLIINRVPSLCEEAGRLLLSSKEVTSSDIYTVIKLVESLREEAWQLLLKMKPNNYELRRVIENVEQLREVAWQELLKMNPTNEQLLDIVEYVKPLREEAQKVLDARTSRKNRDEIAMVMNRKREVEQDSQKSLVRQGLIYKMCALGRDE